MKFLPYSQTAAIPNVIVDGARNDATVLTLSHWPKSGTPAALRADTSTEIVFNHLDSSGSRVEADVVSNNHFDEDGLAGIFAMLDPDAALRYRALLIDIAGAGDFGVFEHRLAARIAFVISAYADPKCSPLPARLFRLPYGELAAELYAQLLGLLPGMLTNVEDFRALWEEQDASLTASEELIEKKRITIEEQTDLDLAIVRLPEHVSCHPFALHNKTDCTRLLLQQGQHVELQYRYESWVQLASRRPASRVALSELANELNAQETSGGRWLFDGVDQITPKLHLSGSLATSLPLDVIVQRVQHHLKNGPQAWDPYR